MASGRRFQFRLRTLLIAVAACAVACAYVGWQAKIVRERRAMRLEINLTHKGFVDEVLPGDTGHDIPWIRTLLGDQSIRDVELRSEVSKEYRRQVRAMFPEARVLLIKYLDSSGGFEAVPFPDEPQTAE
jgi:hypothetical protein